MSRSFYYGATDEQLRTDSTTFSSLINADPESYGLVADQATLYGTLNTAFASALTLWLAPATRTKITFENKTTARDALVANAKMLAAIIQACPTVTNGQRAALGLGIHETPTPVGELTTPTDFTISLDQTGAITLGWKCTQPRGATAVVYQVWRRIGSGAPVCLGTSGKKKFHDATIPAGTASATYKVQAQRSTSASEWAQFTVNFGVDNGETTIASVVMDQPKLAA